MNIIRGRGRARHCHITVSSANTLNLGQEDRNLGFNETITLTDAEIEQLIIDLTRRKQAPFVKDMFPGMP